MHRSVLLALATCVCVRPAHYHRENVTGGPGGFVLEVHDFHSFGEAMTRKPIADIARRAAPRQFAAR